MSNYESAADVAMAVTPDLAALAGGTVPITDGAGVVSPRGEGGSVYRLHADKCKALHIPKMVVPTGLTIPEGRPTAVQLWGRAVGYEDMFDDAASLRNDVEFLYLVQRVAEAIQAAPALRRVDAPLVRDLFDGGTVGSSMAKL